MLPVTATHQQNTNRPPEIPDLNASDKLRIFYVQYFKFGMGKKVFGEYILGKNFGAIIMILVTIVIYVLIFYARPYRPIFCDSVTKSRSQVQVRRISEV